ncbi:hypothetical protein SAMN05428995_103205 [Loktanella sp. DSM 29012]|uniref:hypothetical protein n=1 Tax=Loktanella sp. DSM 29012 TaxID=1881056 RepID=UPI0008CD18F4|nr:hypothetical protein [Loktanella sp. DSM 29012]SEQ20348.1 hypothetical protein SAMN05428995_103205 [Loktanella sp. DSM 29012]
MRAGPICLIFLTACAPAGVAFQNPFTGTLSRPTVPDQTRGAVELAVKSEFPEINRDIAAGGGPALTRAFDAASVPMADRSARIIQLQSDTGLYAASPAALGNALLVWGR